MKFVAIVQSLLFGAFASAASAQGIEPRNAGAVQPRQAEPVSPRQVQSRPAEAVVSRPAPVLQVPASAAALPAAAPVEPVAPRRAPTVASTAVRGGSPKAWHWQAVGDTGVAGDGVARGSQLSDIRCAGVSCRAYQDSAGAWNIRAEGGFPEMAGRAFEVLLMNTRTERAQADGRARGVFANGGFWDQIDTARLPAGSYAVFYHWAEKDRVLAAITFDVRHQASTGEATAGQTAGSKPGGGGKLSQIETAQQNQRCLAMAATNPDIRCTP